VLATVLRGTRCRQQGRGLHAVLAYCSAVEAPSIALIPNGIQGSYLRVTMPNLLLSGFSAHPGSGNRHWRGLEPAGMRQAVLSAIQLRACAYRALMEPAIFLGCRWNHCTNWVPMRRAHTPADRSA
jgi:hypothetical protein